MAITIISEEIVLIIGKPNGHTKHIVRFTDNLGFTHQWGYHHPDSEDIDAAIAVQRASLPNKILLAAKEKVETSIQKGANPVDISNPYLTTDQKNKAIIIGMMLSKKPDKIMPTAEFIDSNISNAQLTNLFTTAQATRIRTRVDRLVANKQFLIDDLASVEEI